MSSCILMASLLFAWRFDISSAVNEPTPTHRPLTEHPPVHNLKVQLVNETTVIVRWEKPENITNNYIAYYTVHVRQTLHDMLVALKKDVEPPVDHLTVSNLDKEVLYTLKVSIAYTDKKNRHSQSLHFNTSDPNVTSYCMCDPYGSYNTSGNGTCQPNLLKCNCKPNYTGSHCSICQGGHYRKQHYECVKCPCNLLVSNGDCEYNMRWQRATCKCKPLKIGPLCELCAPGYYQDCDGKDNCTNEVGCRPCPCPKHKGRPGHCDPRTGECLQCPNGTAGIRCEMCARGWSGPAPHCQPLSAIQPRHSGLTLLASMLAAAAVAVALGLGYWVMRLRARQKRLNAWSLELNRYELEHPGVVDSSSQSGLMMEEAAPGYGGASDAISAAPGPLRKDDQLIFRAARLQLRSAEPTVPPLAPSSGGALV